MRGESNIGKGQMQAADFVMMPAVQIAANNTGGVGGALAGGLMNRFDEPIELLDGRKLRTFKEAIAWLAKEIPKSEHTMPKVQAAARMVTEAAEKDE